MFIRLKGYLGDVLQVMSLLPSSPTENGLLASRIEILTRHQTESLKKMGKGHCVMLCTYVVGFYSLVQWECLVKKCVCVCVYVCVCVCLRALNRI